MQILNRSESCLRLAWSVSPLPRFRNCPAQPLSLHLCAKGTFELVPGGVAVPVESDPELASGDVPHPEGEHLGLWYPNDFVAVKPSGEFLVQGRAHPPKHSRDPVFTATASVGALSKSILVHGERKWDRSILGSKPGLSSVAGPLPLSYAFSYGGGGLELNPLGRGYDGVELHQIESPGAPVHSSGLEVPPVGFGPIPAEWPQRRIFVGTYGPDYVKTSWPWWPDDFDWRYFRTAPPDQCHSDYWRGDEALMFRNLHPEIPELRSRLPGLQVRCFARRMPEPQRSEPVIGDFDQPFEVAMVLDTIWVNPETGRLILSWRGHIPVETIKFPDLKALWVMLEPIENRADLAAVVATDLAQLDSPKEPVVGNPPQDPMDAKPESAELQESEAEQVEKAVAEARANQPVDPAEAAAKDQLEREMAELDRRAQETAKSPEFQSQHREIEKQSSADSPDLDEIAASIADAESRIAELDQKFAKMEETLPKVTTWQDFQNDGVMDTASMRARGLAGVDCREAPFAGLDLSMIDFSGATLSGVDLPHTNFQGSILDAVDFSGCNLAGTNFSGASLAAAKFSENCLDGACFDGALCGDIKFSGLDLRSAELNGLRAPRASFENCDLSEMDLSRAFLAMAEFPGSNLSGANFSGAMLSGGDFRMCNASRARFVGSHLEGIRGDGETDFSRAIFDECQAKGCILEGCILTEARFVLADLREGRFVEVAADGTDFQKADLRKAVCEDSSFVGATFEGANAMQVVFDRSNLRLVRLDRANLFDSSFWETNLKEARWDAAYIPRTRLASPNQ